jgi:hypothetical protein
MSEEFLRLYLNVQANKPDFIVSVEQPDGKITDITKAKDYAEVCERAIMLVNVVGNTCSINVR